MVYPEKMKKRSKPVFTGAGSARASRLSAVRGPRPARATRKVKPEGGGTGKPKAGTREVLRTGAQLERFQCIHALFASGKTLNVPGLAKELRAKGLEVNAKTIRRDLDFMRDRLNLPVSGYDPARGGFYYTEEVRELPLVHVTEGELLALTVARQAVEAYRGTPYARLLEQAFAKLTTGLRDVVSFPGGGLSESISFRSTGTGPVDEALFTAASKAVLARQEVCFMYRKAGYGDPERRRVWPYHLASIGGMWYLAGHDLDRQAMRTFALPRMSEFAATRHRFARDPDFSPEKYFGDSFGMLRAEGTVTVRIEFDGYAGELVRERFWHASQKITEKPGGKIELELRVSHTDEVRRWVLGWGERAKVIEPPELVEEMREVAGELARIYRGA
ncbi:putative transcriptional regulator [Opitutaceae bacterium TAV1]|nr:putative transcriptional regulator [Opitutaceae bacterium TAV1]